MKHNEKERGIVAQDNDNKNDRVYIGLRVDSDLKALLDEKAAKQNRSLSGQVEFMLRKAINEGKE